MHRTRLLARRWDDNVHQRCDAEPQRSVGPLKDRRRLTFCVGICRMVMLWMRLLCDGQLESGGSEDGHGLVGTGITLANINGNE